MAVKQEEIDFLPGIEDYLENVNNTKSVSSKYLEDFIAQVQIKTGLEKNISEVLVAAFFQEIRNGMLRGDVVTIRDLGKFFISGPKFGNKKRIFPMFKPYNKIIKRLNDF